MGQEALTAGEVWDLAAGRLKQRSETLYQQWFGRMPAVALADGVLTLGVNDEFSIDLLREASFRAEVPASQKGRLQAAWES